MKVLISVKTYPTLSEKYDELVCTAGFTESGEWIRIYPVPFRKLDFSKQYSKWEWIEVDLVRNNRDFRPETYKPLDHTKIKIAGKIDTKNGWAERKKIVLRNVYSDKEKLINDAKDKTKFLSLAVFKPTQIIDFIIENDSKDWDPVKLQKIEAERQQLNLFQDETDPLKLVKKLPYKFSYKFLDCNGISSTLMIEDWELGALYWNCLRRRGDPKKACEDVKNKYLNEFLTKNDIYFFLGTTLQFHSKNAPNPFIIIGVFYPPKTI